MFCIDIFWPTSWITAEHLLHCNSTKFYSWSTDLCFLQAALLCADFPPEIKKHFDRFLFGTPIQGKGRTLNNSQSLGRNGEKQEKRRFPTSSGLSKEYTVSCFFVRSSLKFFDVWIRPFFVRVHPQVTIKETAMNPIYRPYSADEMNVLL